MGDRWQPWWKLRYVPQLYGGKTSWRVVLSLGRRHALVLVRGERP